MGASSTMHQALVIRNRNPGLAREGAYPRNFLPDPSDRLPRVKQCDLVVTGASGFVGQHLVASARDAGLEVGTANWDLRDAAATIEHLQALRPRAVAHLAASPRTVDPWTAL